MDGRKLVAIIDDEEAVRVGLGALMRSADLHAELFASAESFLDTNPERFGVVFSDIQMPGRSGLELLVATRAARPRLPIILMTAFPDQRVRERAELAGAYRLLTKPCDPDEIIMLAETLLAANL